MSSRIPIVAGNWKMHGTKAFVQQLLTELKNKFTQSYQAEMIVFPPFVFLDQVASLLDGTPIQWGGQNMAAELEGAYTGEISGRMLDEFGCGYVLLGHSERRQYYGETNEVVAKKVQLAYQCGLQPILCVGETLQQREAGQTEAIVSQQLTHVIDFMGGVSGLSGAIIAYEPVWAIGTGLTATPEQAQEVHAYLRQQLASYDVAFAQRTRILYGGSVKANNAEALFAMPDIDGGLIGGASLDAQDFFQIFQAAN